MFKLNPNARWRWEGEDKIIFEVLIGMNRTAGEILEFYRSANDIDNVTNLMQNLYPKVPWKKLYSDVKRFTNRLLQLDILVPEECENYPDLFFFAPDYMNHLASYFGSKLTSPIRVSCELTSVCNARCLHCYAIPSTPVVSELTTNDWKKVFDELREINTFGVALTGGEALLRNDIEELVKYCSNLNLNPTLATNASVLTKDRLIGLFSSGLTGLLISLDGADAETHDNIRGMTGLYDQVLKVINWLVELDYAFVVHTTIMKLNLHQIPDIMVLAEKLGVPRLSLTNLVNAGRASSNTYLHLVPGDYIDLLQKIYRKEEELPNMLIIYPDIPAAYFEKSIGIEYYKRLCEEGRIGQCNAGITGCEISSVGEVRPCDISGNVTLGNIKDRSLKEIWDHSPIFDQLRKINRKDRIPCRECDIVDICIAGCIAMEHQVCEGGNLYTTDLTCAQCFNSLKKASTDLSD